MRNRRTCIRKIQNIGESEDPPCSCGLIGLILANRDRALGVLLNGDDGHRGDQDFRILVSDPKEGIRELDWCRRATNSNAERTRQ